MADHPYKCRYGAGDHASRSGTDVRTQPSCSIAATAELSQPRQPVQVIGTRPHPPPTITRRREPTARSMRASRGSGRPALAVVNHGPELSRLDDERLGVAVAGLGHRCHGSRLERTCLWRIGPPPPPWCSPSAPPGQPGGAGGSRRAPGQRTARGRTWGWRSGGLASWLSVEFADSAALSTYESGTMGAGRLGTSHYESD